MSSGPGIRKSAPFMAAKREKARESGLCITCCRRRPDSGRRVCPECVRKASARNLRRKESILEKLRLSELLREHEQAGDLTFSYHLHEAAVKHFREALQVAQDETERLRIMEKLAQALAFSVDPEYAVEFLESLLQIYAARPDCGLRAMNIISKLMHGFRSIPDSTLLSLGNRALTISSQSGDLQLEKAANLLMAQSLAGLSRFEEMGPYLANVEIIKSSDPVDMQIDYHLLRGMSTGKVGSEREAFDYLDHAVYLASHTSDVHKKVSAFLTYGMVANNLGNIETTRQWYEHTLLISRENDYKWFSARLSLRYATILRHMGAYQKAHEHILQAIKLQTRSSMIDIALVTNGIPVAVLVGDKDLLRKCADLSVLERFGAQVSRILPNFALYYAFLGKKEKACELLHRALQMFTLFRKDGYSEFDWSLARKIAQFGTLEDLHFVQRVTDNAILGSSKIEASLKVLVLARIAERLGSRERAATLALRAKAVFENLHWYGLADEANTIISGEAVLRSREFRLPADIFHILTKREQLVAELALKNFTNKEISERIGVTEHTVEKHMGSVMRRLDIRSRHQLAHVVVREAAFLERLPEPGIGERL